MQKAEDGEFPAFSEHTINLYLYFWRDTYDKMNVEEFPRLLISCSKTTFLAQLREMIYKKLKLDQNKHYLFNKSFSTLISPTLSHLFPSSEEFMHLTTVAEYGIIDNTDIFVEEDKGESKFGKKINVANNETIVLFNAPVVTKGEKVTIKDYFQNKTFKTHNMATYQEIKARIAEMLGLPEDQFRIKKDNHIGAEVKDMTKIIPIRQKQLKVYVELGAPTLKGFSLTRPFADQFVLVTRRLYEVQHLSVHFD